MQNFTLHTPTKILLGEGKIAEIGKEIPADARILITYGGGSIKRNGVLDQVNQALEGRNVRKFGGIEPNPSYETPMKAVEVVRAENIDFLLAVGGGSVADGTKFIAAAAHYEAAQDPWHIMETTGAQVTNAVKMACVLTLPATGSESNNGAVISRKTTGDKLPFFSPYTFPLFAVLDPVVTYSVRANVMWSATMALNGLIGAGVPQDWATYMMGHELTALHGLDHAQTLAIVLHSLLQAKKAQKRAKLLQYAERVWNLREGSKEQGIDGTIAATRAFFEKMGVPTHMADYQLDGSTIPTLVAKLKEHGMTALGEHADITPEVSQKIYEAAR